MSSPRPAASFDGLICQNTTVAGPIRLPEETPERFIDEFNRVYANIGLTAESSEAIKPSPLPSQGS
jgi:hypothetical protein